jgi:hypothetical protein
LGFVTPETAEGPTHARRTFAANSPELLTGVAGEDQHFLPFDATKLPKVLRAKTFSSL